MVKLELSASEQDALLRWLARRGEPVDVKSASELQRTRLPAGVGVALRTREGALVLTHAYVHELVASQRPAPTTRRERRVDRIFQRDGNGCFYCGGRLTLADATLEHLLARSLGGANVLDNLVAACLPCNERAGALGLVEKVKLRDARRGHQWAWRAKRPQGV